MEEFTDIKGRGERKEGRLIGPRIGALMMTIWGNKQVKRIYENRGEYSELSGLDYAEL